MCATLRRGELSTMLSWVGRHRHGSEVLVSALEAAQRQQVLENEES